MFNNLMLLAVATTGNTVTWSPKVAIIMIFCNILALVIGKFAIANQTAGPKLPIFGFDAIGLPALLAITSFGHILGAGLILGLANTGAL